MIRKILMTAALPLLMGAGLAAAADHTLSDGKVSVTVDGQGRLTHLKNLETGLDYAGGRSLWRLYYDTHDAREVQIVGQEQQPTVSSDGRTITIVYDRMASPIESDIPFSLKLSIHIDENHLVRFDSELGNSKPGSIIRELHYPIVSNLKVPASYQLLTTKEGGNLYPNYRSMIAKASVASITGAYKNQAQKFRQFDAKYPSLIAANCFAFVGERDGIYFGSHDSTFQNTWHGLRLYPDSKGRFSLLEAGFFKYPQVFCGETWRNTSNCIAPYKGTWHVTSQIYRQWADSWWDHRTAPQWVREMKSWQRIILKHQYGEYLFRYKDLNGHIKDVGQSVGCNTIFVFGWWKEGMDNGYPAYSPDDSQGGDEALSRQFRQYVNDGGHIICYFNGKLIDRTSDYYKSGKAREVCYRDNTGADLTEQYRFTGEGTFLGNLNARTFVVADTRNKEWQDILLRHADRAYDMGASSVFYDQLGYCEPTITNWDLSREFPVPNLFVVRDKGRALKRVRDHIGKRDPNFALGTEWLTDATAQYCDYIHMYTTTAGPTSFTDWFRFTFPEVIFTDREIRDDNDIPRRVNNTLLKGLRNDIEIWRCRGLIDQTPIYQAYLAKANAVKEKYRDVMVAGRYNDVFGFTSSNPQIEARSFVTWQEADRMAIVLTNTQKTAQTLQTAVNVPGYRFVESSTLGNASVSADGRTVTLGQYDLAVLLYKKK